MFELPNRVVEGRVTEVFPVGARLGVRVVAPVEPVDLRQADELTAVVVLELEPELLDEIEGRDLIRIDERPTVLGDEAVGEVVAE